MWTFGNVKAPKAMHYRTTYRTALKLKMESGIVLEHSYNTGICIELKGP